MHRCESGTFRQVRFDRQQSSSNPRLDFTFYPTTTDLEYCESDGPPNQYPIALRHLDSDQGSRALAVHNSV